MLIFTHGGGKWSNEELRHGFFALYYIWLFTVNKGADEKFSKTSTISQIAARSNSDKNWPKNGEGQSLNPDKFGLEVNGQIRYPDYNGAMDNINYIILDNLYNFPPALFLNTFLSADCKFHGESWYNFSLFPLFNFYLCLTPKFVIPGPSVELLALDMTRFRVLQGSKKELKMTFWGISKRQK
ncbi:hypothetical protein BYT27DRAFT_7326024 [Phlegmacium glaucopus]|nr:hypothetical protein BYT27DRAFT_7326024 [Phlegmacium glaucopus]